MRLLIIGDIVGRPGRRAVKVNVDNLRKEFNLDFVIANGENAASGKGITEDTAREMFLNGVDVLTMGNHVWSKREAYKYLYRESRIVRPANYPPGTPGMGWAVYSAPGNIDVCVINLAGRIFQEALDCPFRRVDEILKRIKEQTRIIIVDFHAEATSEKMAMGWYLSGRVSAVVGTHTHVQTADERILPGGTAYITDLGMTGPMDSVIGVKKDVVIEKFISRIPRYFEVATGPFQFNGAIIEIDEDTGEAVSIRRVQNYE
ncbi:MAG: TIGR00282 family metallophosphoesterase [Desulfotomaculaceae bacterium]|nr:TIGR00282 family metallophosphoesterase [Desulfotomaculaceae bacterium]